MIDSGFTKYPDGKIIMRGLRQNVIVDVTYTDGNTELPDLLSGEGEIEVNANIDPVSGITFWWGKMTLIPSAVEALGGQWEVTWQGKGTLGASGWTVFVKQEGHGNGGALTGMKCPMNGTLTAAPDLSNWSGNAEGYLKSH